jgi:hypothetical protein
LNHFYPFRGEDGDVRQLIFAEHFIKRAALCGQGLFKIGTKSRIPRPAPARLLPERNTHEKEIDRYIGNSSERKK